MQLFNPTNILVRNTDIVAGVSVRLLGDYARNGNSVLRTLKLTKSNGKNMPRISLGTVRVLPARRVTLRTLKARVLSQKQTFRTLTTRSVELFTNTKANPTVEHLPVLSFYILTRRHTGTSVILQNTNTANTLTETKKLHILTSKRAN